MEPLRPIAVFLLRQAKIPDAEVYEALQKPRGEQMTRHLVKSQDRHFHKRGTSIRSRPKVVQPYQDNCD